MTYVSKSASDFRLMPGTLAEKITGENAKIGTELDIESSLIAAGLKVAKVPLTGGNTDSFAFAWQNPESSKILVFKSVVRIETPGLTENAVMDIGPAANATTSGDTLLDGVALTTAGLFDNVTNKGANGLPQVIVDEKGGTTDYITGKILIANAAELTGKCYIFYTVL